VKVSKRCAGKCKRVKLLREFQIVNTVTGSLSTWCRACKQDWATQRERKRSNGNGLSGQEARIEQQRLRERFHDAREVLKEWSE